MDPRRNPYSPGAGTQPPELAGRDDVVNRANLALARILDGRPARGLVLYGLRGVGKTVLLNKLIDDAAGHRFISVFIEAPEDQSLPAALGPSLRAGLYKLKRGGESRDKLLRAFRALKGFATALKVTYADIELSLDFDKEDGTADSGLLERDLGDLLVAVGEAAQECGAAVLIAIDELQYVKEGELEALIAALHQVGQKRLPITMFAAGLPQLLGKMGQAKSYVERLLEFVPIDKLDQEAATSALRKPAFDEGVIYDDDAVHNILNKTQGYPYFLQEWGKHSWDVAAASPINFSDTQRATESALAELDSSFFRVRFDRLKPSEKKYLRAMAELGPGPHRSGDIADCLGRVVSSVAPVRATLIAKGMVFSSSHGETGFTVPLFDEYMRRIMPNFL